MKTLVCRCAACDFPIGWQVTFGDTLGRTMAEANCPICNSARAVVVKVGDKWFCPIAAERTYERLFEWIREPHREPKDGKKRKAR